MIIRLFFNSWTSYRLSIVCPMSFNNYTAFYQFLWLRQVNEKRSFFLSLSLSFLLKLIFLRHLDRSKHCSMYLMNREKANYASLNWKKKLGYILVSCLTSLLKISWNLKKKSQVISYTIKIGIEEQWEEIHLNNLYMHLITHNVAL